MRHGGHDGARRLITYREAVAEGIAREMRRDPSVVCLGEDIGAAEGVFKTTVGLFKEFGPSGSGTRPISEQAIVGAAMGAAMTGMRPVAEIMFSDFFACCWDYLANEIPKVRYMTGGQVTVPLVVRTANGGGLGFGAQHSQAVENWAFTVPGPEDRAPSTPADVVGLMASAIRSDDPVVFFEHKGLFASKGEPAPPDHVVPLGEAAVVREGTDITLVALASRCRSRWRPPSGSPARASPPRSSTCAAWFRSTCHRAGVGASRRRGWSSSRRTRTRAAGAATVASIVADEGFELLDAPIRRVAARVRPAAVRRRPGGRGHPDRRQGRRRRSRRARRLLNRAASLPTTHRPPRHPKGVTAMSKTLHPRRAPSSPWTRRSATCRAATC